MAWLAVRQEGAEQIISAVLAATGVLLTLGRLRQRRDKPDE
jgi:hypothetical protein